MRSTATVARHFFKKGSNGPVAEVGPKRHRSRFMAEQANNNCGLFAAAIRVPTLLLLRNAGCTIVVPFGTWNRRVSRLDTDVEHGSPVIASPVIDKERLHAEIIRGPYLLTVG